MLKRHLKARLVSDNCIRNSGFVTSLRHLGRFDEKKLKELLQTLFAFHFKFISGTVQIVLL